MDAASLNPFSPWLELFELVMAQRGKYTTLNYAL